MLYFPRALGYNPIRCHFTERWMKNWMNDTASQYCWEKKQPALLQTDQCFSSSFFAQSMYKSAQEKRGETQHKDRRHQEPVCNRIPPCCELCSDAEVPHNTRHYLTLDDIIPGRADIQDKWSVLFHCTDLLTLQVTETGDWTQYLMAGSRPPWPLHYPIVPLPSVTAVAELYQLGRSEMDQNGAFKKNKQEDSPLAGTITHMTGNTPKGLYAPLPLQEQTRG